MTLNLIEASGLLAIVELVVGLGGPSSATSVTCCSTGYGTIRRITV